MFTLRSKTMDGLLLPAIVFQRKCLCSPFALGMSFRAWLEMPASDVTVLLHGPEARVLSIFVS
jgi:hypothetical protein